MHAERTQRAFRGRKPGLLEQLTPRGSDEGFARLSQPLGNVPARRARAWPSRVRLSPPATITPHEVRFGIQQGCAAKRMVGATNSSCAAT